MPGFAVLERCQRIDSLLLASEHRSESQALRAGDFAPTQSLEAKLQKTRGIDVFSRSSHSPFYVSRKYHGMSSAKGWNLGSVGIDDRPAQPLVDGSDLRALTSALDHARTMTNHSSEIRMRNFNFFILVTAALIAGEAKPPSRGWSMVFGAAGIVSSILFFFLDVRGYGMLRYNSRKIEILEPILWARAGITGWTPAPTHGGMKMISHRWIYRTFFVLVGLAWAVALTFSIVGF